MRAVSSRARGPLPPRPRSATLRVLVLLIDKPGHRHQAEGVALSIARLTPVERQPLEIRPRRFAFPALRNATVPLSRLVPAPLLLRLVYGIDVERLTPPQVIVGSGRPAVPPGILLARHFGVPFVYAGLADGMRLARLVDLMLVSVARFADAPNAVFTPVPSLVAPDRLPIPRTLATSVDLAGAHLGLLLGGDAHSHTFTSADWNDIARLVRELRVSHGVRWTVTNSRRTAEIAGDLFAGLERDGIVDRFIDWRRAGSGSVDTCLSADAVLVTEDSVSMMSEAVAARRPVVALRPRRVVETLVDDIVGTLVDSGAMAVLPLATTTGADVAATLLRLTPIAADHRDTIAAAIRSRLPGLFTPAARREARS